MAIGEAKAKLTASLGLRQTQLKECGLLGRNEISGMVLLTKENVTTVSCAYSKISLQSTAQLKLIFQHQIQRLQPNCL